ncbi:Phthalate dioxygenase reductase [Serratia rubidaea]|uniref:Phthalate dioxygenase reductase n=1 Tax=Serratia rubidaea TaxID=61652 RepID=A0A447QDS4_SERRU|nr:Phthalate dioxygenase reductase [Serratia rubidaea]
MSEILRVRVSERDVQGVEVVVLSLQAIDGTDLPAFNAGAHIDLHLADGLIRQYSLCSSPQERHYYRLGILKDPASRGGSLAAHLLQVGDEVTIGAPRNLFALDMSAEHTLLFGGGIGVTPMLAMADELYRAGKSFELHYCGRARERLAFLSELATCCWAQAVHIHADDEGEEQKLNLSAVLPRHHIDGQVYVCGPEGFMDWVITSAQRAGYADERIHREYFNRELAISGKAFEVEVPELDLTVTVTEEESIVAALARAGIKVKVSCEQGVCGTCLANVASGIPEHRDEYLTEEERLDNDQILLCCSRSKSERLVIENFEFVKLK